MQTILKNSKVDISCIYVNYHSVQFLENSLKSLFEWEKDNSYEVIIVNSDASEEKSVALLAEKFQAKVISAFHNPGFGAAVNLGALQAEGEILFFVNPDTQWQESFFENALQVMKKEIRIGALGIQMASLNGMPEKQNCGRSLSCKSFFTPKNLFRKELDWVGGGALFVSQEAFLTVGGFDEHFFLYFEDMDFCVRLKQLGFSIAQDTAHTLIHHGGKSHANKKIQKKYYDQSMYKYAKKHWSFWEYMTFRLLHPLYRFFYPYGRN